MSSKKHSVTIGIQREDSDFFLTLKMVGKLTHEDYKVITPMLDSALKGVKEPKINALIDCLELDGWELHAAWDDFKLGLAHGSEFVNIAIVGDKKWLEVGSKVGSWFISGEVKYFEDINEASEWLKG